MAARLTKSPLAFSPLLILRNANDRPGVILLVNTSARSRGLDLVWKGQMPQGLIVGLVAA